jgi:hypothetical protein
MSISLFKKGKPKNGDFAPSGLTMPVDGLIFYASLKNQQETAETGQALDWDGDVTPDNINGIPCVSSDGSVNVYADTPEMQSATFSFFGIPGNDSVVGISTGEDDGDLFLSVRTYKVYSGEQNISSCAEVTDMANISMAHYAITFTDGSQKLYLNGELIASSDVNFEYESRDGVNVYVNGGCCIASARVYNRVLSADEIKTLSQEFIPAVGFETSSGFDAFGYPLKYRSSKEALSGEFAL